MAGVCGKVEVERAYGIAVDSKVGNELGFIRGNVEEKGFYCLEVRFEMRCRCGVDSCWC